jgi:3-hydroxyacyl-[acyl-carrier-protein] dehydratase
MNSEHKINIEQIKELLPHRYPFLLVDRVIDFIPDSGIIALKNVTINESFFNGHFPGHPIMPGVLIIEALAQAAGIFVMLNSPTIETKNKVVYFMSIELAHFRKPVIPGDSLYLHVEKIKNRGNVWKMKGEAKVEGQRVADAEFTAMIVDKE